MADEERGRRPCGAEKVDGLPENDNKCCFFPEETEGSRQLSPGLRVVALRPLRFGHQALSAAPQPAPAEPPLPGRHRPCRRPSRSLWRQVIAAVPFVIVRAWEQVGRRKSRGAGVVFPFLRRRYRVLRVPRRAAGSVRACAGFAGDGGRRRSGVSDAEDSGSGRGLRKCGSVKEGVGGGGDGRCDGSEGGRRLRSDGGGTRGGEGEEVLRSQRHLPETGR